MSCPEPEGEGSFVERTGDAIDVQAVGHLGSITEGAVEVGTDSFRAPIRGHYPWTFPERRLVSHMLPVQARQLSDPLAVVVLMKTLDRSKHCRIHPLPS
jgi:hypothetical protein